MLACVSFLRCWPWKLAPPSSSPLPSLGRKLFWEAHAYENLPDSRQHQRAERVVDHRLVVDGKQLLAQDASEWVEPSSGAAGEDDALHAFTPSAARTAWWNRTSDAASPTG